MLLAATAAPASASTYCVPAMVSGCTQATTSLQQALDLARVHTGADTVRIATGTYDNGGCPSSVGGISYVATDPVTIIGAGTGKTILTCATDYNNSGHYYPIVKLDGPATLKAVTIHLPAGDSDRGASLDHGAVLDGVAIDSDPSATNVIAVSPVASSIKNSSIAIPTTDDNVGVAASSQVSIDKSTITAGGKAVTTDQGAVISRSTLTAPQGVVSDSSTTDVYDSLIDLIPGPASPQVGLDVYNSSAFTGSLSICARNVTIIDGGPVASFTHHDRRGANHAHLTASGLKPGRYVLRATARIAGGGTSAPVTVSFVVLS